jgi:probable HAF family extracellular repeat protein
MRRMLGRRVGSTERLDDAIELSHELGPLASLPQDRAHRELESVEAADDAPSRIGRQHGGQEPISLQCSFNDGPVGGKPSVLPTFGGSGWNTPTDINERGDVVGFANMPPDIAADGSLEFNPVAFIWTKEKGTQKILPLEGDTNSIAYAINSRGQVVGQSFGGPEGARAFVWENGKATDLNAIVAGDAGMYLIYAEGINDRGEITGQACTFVDNACVFPASPSSPTPTFLAVPLYGTYAGSGVHASVPRELVRRSLRRWGIDRPAQ